MQDGSSLSIVNGWCCPCVPSDSSAFESSVDTWTSDASFRVTRRLGLDGRTGRSNTEEPGLSSDATVSRWPLSTFRFMVKLMFADYVYLPMLVAYRGRKRAACPYLVHFSRPSRAALYTPTDTSFTSNIMAKDSFPALPGFYRLLFLHMEPGTSSFLFVLFKTS